MTAPDLPLEVEHPYADYHLYDEYVGRQIARGIKPQTYSDYMDYSIGFTTRGCFRKCPFCVNQKYDHVFRHSPVKEFFDPPASTYTCGTTSFRLSQVAGRC